MVQLSHLYMTSRKTIALLIWTFVSKVMLSRFVIAGGSEVKASACNVGDLGSFPGLERSLGEGNRLRTPVFWPGEFHGLYSHLGWQRVRHD